MGHRVFAGVMLAFAATQPVAAQQSLPIRPDTPPDVAVAVRAEPAAPRVDGVMDDAVWNLAPIFADFVQRDPDEGRPATEPTEFRVVYTDDALYVGVRAFDSQPDRIAALLTRRDQSSPSDWIGVMIDSYHDRRTAFQFMANPAGVKLDAFLFDDNNEDQRWDAVWEVATTIDAEGWTVEFRIPFDQLRFSAAEANTFGLNVFRRVNRLNEEQYWRPIPKSAQGWVSLFGDLVGIESLAPPRRLEVIPYTVASASQETAVPNDPFRTGSSENATIGADVKYGLSSALTLSATINPDFGQVEADPAVVNLSAFETFFPERRPFFTEGLDIFRFRIADGDGNGSQDELFYTRRIGRRPQGRADRRGGHTRDVENTTILAAAKLSGKTERGWTVGLTGAVTAEESADVIAADGIEHRDVVEPGAAYLVGRVARDFRGGKTQIGLFGTTVQRDVPDRLDFLHTQAYTGGLNWTHRFADNSYQFSGRIVGSHVRGSAEAISRTQRAPARYYQRPDADHVSVDPTRTSLGGYAAAFNIGRTAGNWRWSTGFDTRSPGFEVNDVGFQSEADRASQFVWINRRWLQPGTVFRRFNLNVNQWSGWTYGGERRNIGGNLNANYTLWNYWGGWFGINRNFRGLSTTHLRGGPALDRPGAWNGWFGFRSDDRKTFRGGGGGWFWTQDVHDSWGVGIDGNVSWRPVSNMDFTASPRANWAREQLQYLRTAIVDDTPEYVLGDLHQTTVAMQFRGSMTVTPDLSLQAYVEPFISAGRYEGYRRVVAPRAADLRDQFVVLSGEQIIEQGSEVGLDLDDDRVPDITLNDPDFTFLSFRSNVVLRWEYSLGSTMFFVWQHGRNGSDSSGRFDLGSNIGDLFSADYRNVLLLKVNYWLNP